MHRYLFPPSYSPWLASRLKGILPESLATCQNCAMLNPHGQTRDPGPFLPGLKCCTYFPFLPNFSLGAIPIQKIKTASVHGMLLPVGLYPNPSLQILTSRLGRSGFGRKKELLCPFFSAEKDACSIWENRPGVCTSYFCKSERGPEGLKLWAEIEEYLNQFEWKLACEILNRIGVHANTIAFSQSALSLETEDDERQFFIDAAWNTAAQFFDIQGFENKIKFYEKTTQIAQQISAQDIGKLLDQKAFDLENKLQSQL